MGDTEGDIAEAVWTKSKARAPMVSGEPARTDAGASGGPGPKTQRSLWVFWHYRQLRGPGAVSVGSDSGLAQVAGASGRPARDALGADESAAGVLSPARSARGTFHLRSEAVTRGTVCGKFASTGLWGCRRVTVGTT